MGIFMYNIFYMRRNKKNITIFYWLYLHLCSTIKFKVYCLCTDKNGKTYNNKLANIIVKYCN